MPGNWSAWRKSTTAKLVDIGTVSEHMNVSFVDECKNLFNVSRVKTLFRTGTELFNALQPYIEKPTVWNAGKVVFSIGKVLADDATFDGDQYFGGDEWMSPYSRDFNPTIMGVLSKFPRRALRTFEEGIQVHLIDLGGVKAGWTYNTKLNAANYIYVETEKVTLARGIIKKLLWEQFKGQSLVMRLNKGGSAYSSDDPKIVFEVDDAFHPLPSAKATEYGTYLKRCTDAGVPRSVMLYGPPGTGKSTLARTLVNNLGMRSFRIRIEDVASLDNATLFEAIDVFEPDAVILDDFDRARSQAALLETLEFFQRHVKLVVATVNDRNELDEALLRPGRFDELVEVDRMDENVVKNILGKYVDGFEVVKTWPIAFIQEYVKRRTFMSADEAKEGTVELAQRVMRLNSYKQSGDVERMITATGASSPSDADDTDDFLDDD